LCPSLRIRGQLPAPIAEEVAFENDRISKFKGLVTLTLDQVILHVTVHHSSTSTNMPNFTEIEETFCGRMNIWTDSQTDTWDRSY